MQPMFNRGYEPNFMLHDDDIKGVQVNMALTNQLPNSMEQRPSCKAAKEVCCISWHLNVCTTCLPEPSLVPIPSRSPPLVPILPRAHDLCLSLPRTHHFCPSLPRATTYAYSFPELDTCAYPFISINSSSIFCVSVANFVNFRQNLMLFHSSAMIRKNKTSMEEGWECVCYG